MVRFSGFFSDPTAVDWRAELDNCASQLEGICRVNQTKPNQEALYIINRLQSRCDEILHPPIEGPLLS